MDEQGKQKLKRLEKLIIFFNTPRGQVVASCCAYGSLVCIAISSSSSDYSRLALPFTIVTLLLAFLGTTSRSQRRIAQVALALWVIPVNIMVPVLFNLGTQVGQQTHLQTQIVQLENLHNRLQDQGTTLKQQFLLLQKQIVSGDGGQVVTQVKKDQEQTTATSLSDIADTLQYINSLVNYDSSLQKDNDRNLARDGLISDNQDAINTNGQEIKNDQQFVEGLNQTIENNNAILPVEEDVQPVVWIDQANCVSGYPCQGSSWLQPFVDGWQRIIVQPISTTWFFWLLLVGGVVGLFLLLPLTISKNSTITYRVLYYGLLMKLNDPGFPEQKRQELGGETSILKIEIRPTFFLRQHKGQTDEYRDFLHLIPDAGTTVMDVFLKEDKKRKADETREVSYDKTTNSIILKMKPILIKGIRRFPPIQIYAVVDYFAGSLKAETPTPFSWIGCVQELRGPLWLLRVSGFFHGIFWYFFAAGAYLSLMVCSYYFFGGDIFPAQWFRIGLIVLAVALAMKIVEVIMMKVITKQQPIMSGTLPAQA